MRRLHALISHALECGFAQTQFISLFSRTPTGVNVIQSVCLWKGSRDKKDLGTKGTYATEWMIGISAQGGRVKQCTCTRTWHSTKESGFEFDCGSSSYPYTIPYGRVWLGLWKWKSSVHDTVRTKESGFDLGSKLSRLSTRSVITRSCENVDLDYPAQLLHAH